MTVVTIGKEASVLHFHQRYKGQTMLLRGRIEWQTRSSLFAPQNTIFDLVLFVSPRRTRNATREKQKAPGHNRMAQVTINGEHREVCLGNYKKKSTCLLNDALPSN